jgi:hypothetical protein
MSDNLAYGRTRLIAEQQPKLAENQPDGFNKTEV